MADWDEAKHPRDPRNGEFTENWAGQVVARMFPRRLPAALASGVASEEQYRYQGNSGDDITHVRFNDGTVGIRKKLNPTSHEWDRSPEEKADAEVLGSVTARAFDIPSPEVARTAPDEVVSIYIPGTKASPYTRWTKNQGLLETTGEGREAPGRAHTEAEMRLAVFDLLTENHDRTNPTNLRMTEDGLRYAIDFSKLFGWEADRGPGRPGNGGGPGPYAQMFVVGFEDPKWATNPLTAADIAWVRGRLDSLRPEYETAGRLEWWQGMSDRLDAVAKKARGTTDLLAGG